MNEATWSAALALLIALVLVPMAIGMALSAWHHRCGPRPTKPWAPVPPAGLRRVRIAAQLLTYTQAPVAAFLGMLALAVLNPWLIVYLLFLGPPFVLTGALFVRAATRVREPHLGWRWYDLTLTLSVLAGGTYLWLFALWRARGDVDPLKGFWLCVAASWLLAVAIAAGLILRSWRQPTRSAPRRFSELR